MSKKLKKGRIITLPRASDTALQNNKAHTTQPVVPSRPQTLKFKPDVCDNPVVPQATDPAITTLLEMLTYRRRHDSETEREWGKKYLLDAGFELVDDMVYVFSTDPESTTLFTAHCDSVHSSGGRQDIVFDEDFGLISRPTKATECLGADDAAGVWLLLQMIEAGVPGTYMVFRGEERGGIGSSYVADKRPDLLEGFTKAIAFDRRGNTDVIFRQGGSRCASDAFAEALANALVEQGLLGMAPCAHGVFTDTANLTDDIAECTNISVGYDSEHSSSESQDVEFLCRLRDACIAIEWWALPVKRQPGEVDNDWGSRWGFCSRIKSLNDWDYSDHATVKRAPEIPIVDCLDDLLEADLTYTELEDLVLDFPEVAASIMQEAIATLGGNYLSVDFNEDIPSADDESDMGWTGTCSEEIEPRDDETAYEAWLRSSGRL